MTDSLSRLNDATFDGGWRFNQADRRAHYFRNGQSLCHTWAQTTLDKPAAPGATRCEACKEMNERAAV